MGNDNSDRAVTKDVKPFGDGGAHVTVPADWVGNTVTVKHANWDSELGGETQQSRGKAVVTIYTQDGEQSRVAGPYARKQMAASGQYVLGVKHLPSNTTESIPYGLSDDAFSHHLPLLGRTGYGKSALQVNLSWQLENSSRPFRVIDLKGDLTNSLCSRIDAECRAPTRSDEVFSLDVADSDESIYDLSNLVPNVQQMATVELLEQFTEVGQTTGGNTVPVLLDELPVSLTAELVSECTTSGVCLIPAVQESTLYSTPVMNELTRTGRTILFSMGADEVEHIQQKFDGRIPHDSFDTVRNLDPYQAVTVDQTASSATPFELFPEYPPEME